MLAVWTYMDPTLVTQAQLNRSTATAATQSFIMTPRSITTERLQESPVADLSHDLQEENNLGASAEAGRVAQAVEPGEETSDSLPGDESESVQDEDTVLPVFTLDPEQSQNGSTDQTQVSTQEESDSQLGNQQRSYLLNTKLEDGSSALLLDIGSVGNLIRMGKSSSHSCSRARICSQS